MDSRTPLYDNIIVKEVNEAKQTQSGILLVHGTTDNTARGTILRVGDGILMESGELRPLTVQVGDKVLFMKGSGTTVKIDEDEVLLMRESDILAIFEDDANE